MTNSTITNGVNRLIEKINAKAQKGFKFEGADCSRSLYDQYVVMVHLYNRGTHKSDFIASTFESEMEAAEVAYCLDEYFFQSKRAQEIKDYEREQWLREKWEPTDDEKWAAEMERRDIADGITPAQGIWGGF